MWTRLQVATVLSEKREEVGISIEVEALLRASVEAATFAIDRYVAVGRADASVNCNIVPGLYQHDATTSSHLRAGVVGAISQGGVDGLIVGPRCSGVRSAASVPHHAMG
jgi:hypothetical protein